MAHSPIEPAALRSAHCGRRICVRANRTTSYARWALRQLLPLSLQWLCEAGKSTS
ncbi:hypothetical protein [Polaromonas sp. DSR2-3-2]|uniref:hypothetical protein n=1 Tax=Polaromonas sp. DSR2-3-2 TaxID=2804622 RepID=UPI003CF92D2B